MRVALYLLLVVLPIAATAECVPTPGRTVGTHYDLEKATHQPGDLGMGLTIHGRVLAAPDCRPLPKVRITHWQAGEAGRYEDRFYAWRNTDEQGAYRFETEWPALSPPHIHFLVDVQGYRPLATQWIADGPTDEVEFDLILAPER